MWADLARGVGDGAEPKRHLERGCEVCAQDAAFWGTVTRLARQAVDHPVPPAEAVSLAKRSFALAGPERPPGWNAWLLRLVRDASQGLAVEGVRSASAAQRFLYESESLSVDLLVDASRGRRLQGQVLEREGARSGLRGVPVLLYRAGVPIARTVTSDWGEFVLVDDADEGTMLVIELAPESSFVIPLPFGNRTDAPGGP